MNAAMIDLMLSLLVLTALALLVGCYLWERSWSRRGHETLIDLSLLKVRSYMFGLGLGTFYFAGFTSIFLIITLYLQVGAGPKIGVALLANDNIATVASKINANTNDER